MALLISPESALRSETKYFISPMIRAALLHDIAPLVSVDQNRAGMTDEYRVDTLYFDSPARSNYTDKLAGVPHRTKFRIRQYGGLSHTRHLELKQKIYSEGRKRRVALSPEEYERVVSGHFIATTNPVHNAFWRSRNEQSLSPWIVVEYTRLALVSRVDTGARVTLDSNMTARSATRFEERRSQPIPALAPGQTILELKWSGAMPFWMQFLVQKYSLRNSAISKYCMGVQALASWGLLPHV